MDAILKDLRDEEALLNEEPQTYRERFKNFLEARDMSCTTWTAYIIVLLGVLAGLLYIFVEIL